ncbi:MAG: beta-N-acetylhexosaminidase [Bryobacter sp.]|nr:beta-N-acetylhexosaminidase [Bryobacter sp.]
MNLLFFFALLAAEPKLIPLPVSYDPGQGALVIRQGIDVTGDARVARRLARGWGVPLQADAPIRISVRITAGAGEAYSLTVAQDGVRIDAETSVGALHAAETLLQLSEREGEVWRIPACRITDRPRYGWRGLLLDVSRHFFPIADLERTIDGMAAVKLNVLHLHLIDDQAFRFESRRYPQLNRFGPYYRQEELRALVRYAEERGVRVVPEIDVPCHATAIVAALPELGSGPALEKPETRFGVFDACLDPSREEVYRFLAALFGEVASVFPDAFVHVGGDEGNGKQWAANARIAAFAKERGFGTQHDLQNYFLTRVETILRGHGRRMIAWDEALHPKLPPAVLLQAWRGPTAVAATTGAGRETLVSAGFYLDWNLPAAHAYLRDPAGHREPPDKLERFFARQEPQRKGAIEARRILGGEACLWAEMVTPRNLDLRLWPRLGAIAERLWSPAEVRDLDSLHARLSWLESYLPRVGPQPKESYRRELARLGISQSLADLLEPATFADRILLNRYDTASPMDQLADIVRPDSAAAREFNATPSRTALEAIPRPRDPEALRFWQQIQDALAGRALPVDPPRPEIRLAIRPGLSRLRQ